MAFRVPEAARVTIGDLASDSSYGNNGLFLLSLLPFQRLPRDCDLAGCRVICSDGAGWDHVSVSRRDRCPTWVEMHTIKLMFWDAEDCVMQLHPPASNYVNCHPFCLHLWRPQDQPIPQPPWQLVGLKASMVAP
jgi:hypothetical protein